MKTITAIVETPKGQGLKYDFDPELGCIKLTKIMPAGLVFPFDFGYIPGTLGQDGDPVDVLLISETPTFPGCAVDCRVIGGIKARQKELDGSRMRNDRIIAIPEVSLQYAAVEKLGDLPKELITQIETFFENYNDQAGKTFEPLTRLTSVQAQSIIEEAKAEAEKDTLVKLFIPMYDQDGQRFPKRLYTKLDIELKERFGGLTVYTQSPAKGLWKEDGSGTKQDQLLVYEVMTTAVENNYWKPLKAKLEKQFDQAEVLILMSKIRKV